MSQSNRASRWWFALVLSSFVVYAGGFLHGRFTAGSWPFGSLSNATSTDEHAGHDHSDLSKSPFNRNPSSDSHGDHDHEEHGHDEHAHDAAATLSLEVTETARKNLGLTDEFLQPLELRDYTRTLSVPSIIVDKPGRTRLPVSAPMTGIVTHVHAVPGEAIKPGDLILEMRLTHEDLVTSQKEYLQTLGERDIELKQIARIEGLATAGAVSNKTLVERQFNRDKLESQLRSQREALRLHGLSDVQITRIDEQRRLLTEVQIVAPHPDDHAADEELRLSVGPKQSLSSNQPANAISPPAANPFRVASTDDSLRKPQPTSHDTHWLVLQELNVQKGQIVNAGDALCELADYQELLIEGQAFETEANIISKAKTANWRFTALLGDGADAVRIEDLVLSRVDNEIDPATRTLKFYVELENTLIDAKPSPEGQLHVSWKYRTGQRLQILLPIEQWTQQIVLPIDAVVREGLNCFVFQQNGDHFERVAVHEIYRDQFNVVIANDGTLYPGDVVAQRGAYQMQLALKNQAGGAVDPHAGHNH